jgi:molybdopterin-guanine dinucleotide biosynthesis protein B
MIGPSPVIGPGPVIGLTGRPGRGKTTLMLALVAELTARGLAVSTVVAAANADQIDQPGKDSHRHREAGAAEVMVTGARRWALIHGGGAASPGGAATARMSPVDVVLAEGAGDYPGIEVYRAAGADGPPLCHDDPRVVAVASDTALEGVGVPVLDLGDIPAIADFIIARFGLT